MGIAYETYLVAATDRRLLLISTESGLFGDVLSPPTALNGGVTVLEHDAVLRVTTGPVGGIGGGKALVLQLHLGATRWGEQVRFDSFPRIAGLDAQEQLHSSFVSWLCSQVARGAFPMSAATQARVAAHAAERAAAGEAQAQAARARAERTSNLIHLGPWLVRLGLPLVPALFTLRLRRERARRVRDLRALPRDVDRPQLDAELVRRRRPRSRAPCWLARVARVHGHGRRNRVSGSSSPAAPYGGAERTLRTGERRRRTRALPTPHCSRALCSSRLRGADPSFDPSLQARWAPALCTRWSIPARHAACLDGAQLR